MSGEMKQGTVVTVSVSGSMFSGKIVGKGFDDMHQACIVECTDGTIPNDVYRYNTYLVPLSSISIGEVDAVDARDNEKLEPHEKEPCNKCGKHRSFEGHDGCLRELDGVMNACCGHTDQGYAYVQFWDGVIIDGKDALVIIEILKRRRSLHTQLDRLCSLSDSCRFIAQDLETSQEGNRERRGHA